MTARRKAYDAALEASIGHARAWLDSVGDRPIAGSASVKQVRDTLGEALPEGPTDPDAVIRMLAEAVEPGLVASLSGRYFGFVVGGVHPAALAADWLVSAWDQNAGLQVLSPANVAVEDIASGWLLDVLRLPAGSAVGFTTGATMSNFTGLAAARDAVLARAGWDTGSRGLAGAPPVRVLVGEERHDTVDLALRYLGLGEPAVVPADGQGRIRPDALAAALRVDGDRPTIVCLQAGNVHSGAFDPFEDAIAAAREAGAWVHVDGAFGLWAAASPRTRPLTAGVADADSWATDAHKTLNVPYDSGIAIVRDPAAMRSAMSFHGEYLIVDDTRLEPYQRVPEASRRARAFPVWAVLRSLGRSGVADLVDRLCGHARALAEGAQRLDRVEVVNDVVFTQVCLTFGSDERTRAVARRLIDDGSVWMSGSRWRGRDIVRISVSNWSTDDEDVARSLEALEAAVTEAG